MDTEVQYWEPGDDDYDPLSLVVMVAAIVAMVIWLFGG